MRCAYPDRTNKTVDGAWRQRNDYGSHQELDIVDLVARYRRLQIVIMEAADQMHRVRMTLAVC